MATDTISMDWEPWDPATTFTSGEISFDFPAVVLAPKQADILGGWEYPRPILAEFQASIWEQTGAAGSEGIYDGNPLAILLDAGETNGIGNAGDVHAYSNWYGTFDDFSIFYRKASKIPDATQIDPTVGAVVIGSQYVGPTAYGAIGTPWAQYGFSMVPPKGARFAVPRVAFPSGVTAGTTQYLDAFNFRILPKSALNNFLGDNLAVWNKPRSLNVAVTPTRKNLSSAPRLHSQNASSGNYQYTDTITSTFSGLAVNMSVNFRSNIPGTRIIQNSGSASGWLEEKTTVPVTPGEWLTYSVHYYSTSAITGEYVPLIQFEGPDNLPLMYLFADAVGTEPITGNTHGAWLRVSVTTQVPDNAVRVRLRPVYQVAAPTSTDTFWVSGVLLDESAELRDWFDGGSGEDYLWQQGLTNRNWGMSYYYEDRVKRNYILTKTLQENVPLGMTVNAPVYADASHPDQSFNTAPDLLFGSGLYGSGPFGG